MSNKATVFAESLEILEAPADSKNIDQPICSMTKKGASNRAFFVACLPCPSSRVASRIKEKTLNP
jgi:hypothetical protein